MSTKHTCALVDAYTGLPLTDNNCNKVNKTTKDPTKARRANKYVKEENNIYIYINFGDMTSIDK